MDPQRIGEFLPRFTIEAVAQEKHRLGDTVRM